METNNNTLTLSGTYSGIGMLTGSSNPLFGSTLNTSLTNNCSTMRQVKVAVFSVVRNDKGTTTSSKFLKELWVEVKNGASLELVVAKHLDKDYDAENIVIKEITSIWF
jgi:hypothetical protein